MELEQANTSLISFKRFDKQLMIILLMYFVGSLGAREEHGYAGETTV